MHFIHKFPIAFAERMLYDTKRVDVPNSKAIE